MGSKAGRNSVHPQPQRGASRPQPALPGSVLQTAGHLSPPQAWSHFLCFPFPSGMHSTHSSFLSLPVSGRRQAHLRVKKNVRVFVPPVLESVTSAVRNAYSKSYLSQFPVSKRLSNPDSSLNGKRLQGMGPASAPIPSLHCSPASQDAQQGSLWGFTCVGVVMNPGPCAR